MRVFAAGSFTNVATWALVLVLLVALYQPAPTGVLVTGFTNGSPAQTAGLPQWSIISQVNNYSTSDVQHLGSYLGSLSPGTNVTVHFSNPSQTLKVTTGKSETNSSRAILGVQTANYVPLKYQFLPVVSSYQLLTAFGWMQLILLGVALVNMLPLFPFDGDRYLDTLLGVLGLKNTKNIRTVASVISLGLLGSNIILSYILFGTIFPR